MKPVALDMFGPLDVTTLGEIVMCIDRYDDNSMICVPGTGRLRPETPALVSDRSQAACHICAEAGLVEWLDVDSAKEAIGDVEAMYEEPGVEDFVAALKDA